ncbi:hypothetical protein SB6421_01834 [Klebsiella huaxiensis]|uniref:Uncharacterized protein n=1 Tax=Klebsiella huaxiensis TaxID=2153354 RepID=A0A564PL91_9ENTR|nr:hypothetical protein SB6422_00666 [Klebsiella huaxiensis]VUT19179.1 hypothetical protein SB6421_01834 [Klebsiella huaxiensis]
MRLSGLPNGAKSSPGKAFTPRPGGKLKAATPAPATDALHSPRPVAGMD